MWRSGYSFRNSGRTHVAGVRPLHLVFVVLLTACAGNFERGARYAATGYVVAMTACDVGQTYTESDGGRWDVAPEPGHRLYESDPLLGPTPAPGLLATNLALTSAVTLWVATKAPRWAAWSYLVVVGVAETYLVDTRTRWGGVCGVR